MNKLLVLGLSFVTSVAVAEDSISLIGNYYKERSTRVVAPSIIVNKELPYEVSIEAAYLVDQITSASGAFTASDEAFQEYRNEFSVRGNKKLGDFTPGLRTRFSHEADYLSLMAGADIEWSIFEGSNVSAFFEHQYDDVMQRSSPVFRQTQNTTLFGLGFTQVLAKPLVVGASIEAQWVRGYQENPYRVENHPRLRNRYAGGLFSNYHFAPTDSTARISYRIYWDSWDLVGHTLDVSIAQRVIDGFEAVPRVRYYTQNSVFFDTITPDGFLTSDPKLFEFSSMFYGLDLYLWTTFLQGTFLDVFATSQLIAGYGFLDQNLSYGPAHVAQLGWHWPF